LTNVLLQKDWEVSNDYQINGTPSAVLVGLDGKVASPVVAGPEAIHSLVVWAVSAPAPQLPVQPQQTAQQAAPAGPEVGDPAPPLKLRDLTGKKINLATTFGGEKTLVVFWNPGCGFCQQMLDDLKDWEASPPEGAPKLLFVSAGTKEANRAMGLRSTVVLDQNFSVGRAFGASGTPSAVLVDEEGKVASELVVGGPAVLALSGATQSGV
jgi:protein-disulfide isomerase